MAYIILTDEMGARLENEILVRGWSLRDFAKKSGVSVSAISRYINGEVKKVNARTIYKFATTLGTTVDWLRWGAQQNRKNDLISREDLKKTIAEKIDEQQILRLHRVQLLHVIVDIIDNAPAVDVLPTSFEAKKFLQEFRELKDFKKEHERPQGENIIKCKDCKYQKKCWHEDKRMKEKGYWIYWCELISDSFVGTPVWGEDNQFCSNAERVDI